MLKRMLKNEKGLTLIELLAVVVILGIIAAIAVPAIGKIIDDSRDKAIVSDALQLINAAKIAKAAGEGSVSGDTETYDKATLEKYVDSEIKADAVSVTFTSNVWTIEGYTKFSDIKKTNTFSSNTATEKALLEFLDGKKATTGGGTGDTGDTTP